RHGRAVSNQVPDVVGEALVRKFSI
ncbi:pantetheine-phosphate adenylyltransferase, partial [Leptospira sp. 96542]|nr:pantetheine-phosphate adenylyltransferase [Leptospira sp. 96542]